MSVYSDIRQALYLGVDGLYRTTNYSPTIIHSNSNGREPANSYVSIHVVTLEQTGRSVEDFKAIQESPDDDFLTTHFESFHNATVQFSFHGSEAGELAEVFHRLVTNYVEVRMNWARHGLAPVSKTPIRYAPQRRETQWIDGFNLDVTFSYRVHEAKKVEWVERITMIENGGERQTIPSYEDVP